MSMGQPRRWQPYTSGVATFGRDDDANVGVAFGVYHSIGSPVTGVFGLAGEVYGLAGGEHATGGARLLAVSRAVNLGYGVDWDAREGNLAFMLSWSTAVRRGGIFGRGTLLRVDWIPPRSSGLDVGLTIPLAQRYAGRTRPRSTDVDLPEVARAQSGGGPAPPGRAAMLREYRAASRAPLPPGADSALRAVREAARLIRVYTNFFSEHHESSREREVEATRELARRVRDSIAIVSARYPHGRTAAAAQRVYTAELERAFAIAVGDTAAGAAVARRARAGLLTHAILPYDALLGRVKNDQYDLSPLADATALDFLAWLRDSSGVPAPRQALAAHVHREWLAVIGEVHRRLVAQWTDSRRVWLPLQLALAPEEHDDQAEIDALIERAEGRSFTAGNQLMYLHENDAQVEIARSILVARDYHVLWLHDFAGRRPSGAVDRVGFRQVADIYFPALTRAAERFDSTGRLTTYLLFLDQNFYEPNDGRLWMTILEDPLGADVKLPEGNDSLAAHLRARQQALRDAVGRSRGLQALAARGGGEQWLRRTVKVHVSITQPSDFTFRSHRIIPPIPLLPDNLMRDHRKIAFYDVTEGAPYRGAMVLSGVGVGEHYSSATWQDRGMLIRGPAVLEVRAAARRLLRLNGFKDADVPPPLRETPGPKLADGRTSATTDGASGGAAAPDIGRAMLVMNEPGFGRKQATVARAMLYSLAPRGSVLVVPDGLWLDGAWAGMLAGAALRGCRVYVVAPAIANAPSAGFPQMAHTGDVILRLLQVRQEFGEAIHAAGGELRVGLFAPTEDVNDISRQMHEVTVGVERNPWLRELVPFPANVLAVLDSAPAILAAAGYRPFALGRDETPRLPQLHQKTQFLADSAALVRLAGRPEWRAVAVQYLLARAAQTRRGVGTGALAADTLRAALIPAAMALLDAYVAARPPADSARMTFYFTVGTQNQDPRGMMLDGEAVLVASGLNGAIGLFDMYSLLARTTWVETEAELDRLLPPYDNWQRRLGRFVRFVL
ncbi:MAG TPA: hypothetical protein VHQ45_03945 [Gemmatimonadaceae bacterium]|nr:hypothetical protein [Gemmatimonadaceae bacterium]